MILAVCPNPSVDTLVHFDGFNPGSTNRIRKEDRFPGGKGVHVALAAAELGAETRLLGIWAGPSGEWIRRKCEERGVACRGVEVEGWTRSCITFRTGDEFDNSELLAPGPAITRADFDHFADSVLGYAKRASCAVISGSWPPGAADTDTASLARALHDAGVPVFLDGSGEAFSSALGEAPFLAHVNLEECRTVVGRECSPVDGARTLADRCGTAVVTAGAAGAWVASDGFLAHLRCPVRPTASPVGSGDCLVGGMAAGHDKGMSLLEMARLGVACGAANCLRPEIGMFHRADVERLATLIEEEILS